jgi:hypothetical protein
MANLHLFWLSLMPITRMDWTERQALRNPVAIIWDGLMCGCLYYFGNVIIPVKVKTEAEGSHSFKI